MWKKIIQWLKTSHRYLHLLGGLMLGVISSSLYMAVVVGCSTAGALELKDYLYNKRITAWDWIDFALTFGGAVLGYLIKSMII